MGTPIQKYSKEVEDLISLCETEKMDKCKMAQLKLFQNLQTSWRNGDLNALLVMQKIIRREFNTNNYRKEQLQKMALQVMASNPQLSIEPLLTMVRDQNGNLAFPKDYLTYLYYPSKILDLLQNLALSGFETKKLVYEFIRIGTKLDIEIPEVQQHNACSYTLFNIKRRIYGGDDMALLASIPALNDDEKKFLIGHNYKISA